MRVVNVKEQLGTGFIIDDFINPLVQLVQSEPNPDDVIFDLTGCEYYVGASEKIAWLQTLGYHFKDDHDKYCNAILKQSEEGIANRKLYELKEFEKSREFGYMTSLDDIRKFQKEYDTNVIYTNVPKVLARFLMVTVPEAKFQIDDNTYYALTKLTQNYAVSSKTENIGGLDDLRYYYISTLTGKNVFVADMLQFEDRRVEYSSREVFVPVSYVSRRHNREIEKRLFKDISKDLQIFIESQQHHKMKISERIKK